MVDLRLRTMVVGDEKIIQTPLKAFLEDNDYDVFIASSSEEALEILKENRVDVSIMDVGIPGTDGNELMIKAHQLQPQMKFLIHTGSISYQPSSLLEAIGVHKEHVYIKPLKDIDILAQGVRKLLESKT